MQQKDLITFEYCGETMQGHLTGRMSNKGEIIFFKDFDGSNAWIGRDQVKEIKKEK